MTDTACKHLDPDTGENALYLIGREGLWCWVCGTMMDNCGDGEVYPVGTRPYLDCENCHHRHYASAAGEPSLCMTDCGCPVGNPRGIGGPRVVTPSPWPPITGPYPHALTAWPVAKTEEPK